MSTLSGGDSAQINLVAAAGGCAGGAGSDRPADAGGRGGGMVPRRRRWRRVRDGGGPCRVGVGVPEPAGRSGPTFGRPATGWRGGRSGPDRGGGVQPQRCGWVRTDLRATAQAPGGGGVANVVRMAGDRKPRAGAGSGGRGGSMLVRGRTGTVGRGDAAGL